MPLNQLVAPTLHGTSIKLLVDDIDDASYSVAEQQVGTRFPLLKLRNTIINAASIKAFELSYGTSLLPVLSFTFEDKQNSFTDQDFPIAGDTVTCLIRKSADAEHDAILADFLVSSCYTTDKQNVTVAARLFVPKLYEVVNKNFGLTDSLNALTVLCKDLGLGLITNTSTSDTRLIRQYTETNMSMLESVLSSSFIQDGMLTAHIDPFYNLYVVDPIKLLNTTEPVRKIGTDIVTGADITPPVDLIYSNSADASTRFRFNMWRPINKSDAFRQHSTSSIKEVLAVKDYDNQTVTIDMFDSAIIDKSNDKQADALSSFNDGRTCISRHTKYGAQPRVSTSNDHNNVMSQCLNKVPMIEIAINKVNIAHRLADHIDIDLFNYPSMHGTPWNDGDTQDKPTQEPLADNQNWTKNTQFSGQYVVVSSKMRYKGAGDSIKLRHILRKRFYGAQHMQQGTL